MIRGVMMTVTELIDKGDQLLEELVAIQKQMESLKELAK